MGELYAQKIRSIDKQKEDLEKYKTATQIWLTEAERKGRMQHPKIQAVAAERDSLQAVIQQRTAEIDHLIDQLQQAKERQKSGTQR